MDVFYDVSKLSLENKFKILRDAKGSCYKWWVDKLDCKKSSRREKIKMSFGKILEKLDKSSHFVIIHRIPGNNLDYLEFGFSTKNRDGGDYFLWIYVDIIHINFFTIKYKLKILN